MQPERERERIFHNHHVGPPRDSVPRSFASRHQSTKRSARVLRVAAAQALWPCGACAAPGADTSPYPPRLVVRACKAIGTSHRDGVFIVKLGRCLPRFAGQFEKDFGHGCLRRDKPARDGQTSSRPCEFAFEVKRVAVNLRLALLGTKPPALLFLHSVNRVREPPSGDSAQPADAESNKVGDRRLDRSLHFCVLCPVAYDLPFLGHSAVWY